MDKGVVVNEIKMNGYDLLISSEYFNNYWL